MTFNTIEITDYSIEQFTALVSISMNDLNWQNAILQKGKIIGRTKMGLFVSGEQVEVSIENNIAVITSKSLQLRLFNSNKNKANISSLIEYITLNKIIYSAEKLSEYYEEMMNVSTKGLTDKIIISRGAHYATYGLIITNTIVFIAMVASGISFFNPSVMDIYHWGANVRLYTLGGEWWRLITNVFLHIGFFHLFFNMYALFFVGRYLEPILNKWMFLLIYLCTGILASLTSIWWSGSHASAGASGAIFGMYGTFIALLTTNLIDSKVRFGLLQSIVIFVAYSLFSGMQPGVDNSAHIGGLLSGLLLGYIFYFVAHQKKSIMLAASMIAISSIGFASFYLIKNKSEKIKLIRYFNNFTENEENAINVRKNIKNKTTDAVIIELDSIATPAWQTCSKIVDSISLIKQDTLISKEKIKLLKEYVDARIKENTLMIAAEKYKTKNNFALDSIQTIIINKLDSLRELKY